MSKTQFLLGILQIFLCGLYFAYDYIFISFIFCGTGIWMLWPALNKKEERYGGKDEYYVKKEPPVIK
jgi:hypothetical protein